MKTVRLTLVTAVVALFAVFAPSSPAQAYPGVTVTVTDAELIGGNDVTITATVSPAGECAWSFTYGGQTKTGTGSSITSTFHTPVVSARTPTVSTATCAFDNGNPSDSAQSSTGTGQVILLPQGDDNGDGDGNGDADGNADANGDADANADGGNADGGNTDGGNADGGNADGGNTDGGNTDGGNKDGIAVVGGGSGGGGLGGLGGLLPNTGGERLAWLVIGGLLVLVGGGSFLADRRRA